MEKKASAGLKNKLPWIIAIVLGVLSIAAVNKFMRLQEQGKEAKLVYLITAAKDMPPEHELKRDDLRISLFPAEASSQISITVPGNATPTAAEETERKLLMLIGRKTNRTISGKEQVFWSDLMPLPKDMFPEHIPANMRAISIPVTNISSVSNLIDVGDKVDVVFTGENTDSDTAKMLQLISIPQITGMSAGNDDKDTDHPAPSKPETEPKHGLGSVVLLANVGVIATGGNFKGREKNEDPNSGYSSVTLLVTPEEGVLLTQAMSVGQLSLMLRSQADASAGQTMEITNANLIESARKLNRKRNPEVKK